VVICSTRKECEEINDACIKRVEGNEVVYEALDTDHHGHPLREADLERLKRYRERLPDQLVLKVGARVVLRRNLDIESGWVNGTLAVVTHLHDNCIIVQKLSNPSHRHPIPRFRQKIEIRGASYTIMRQQFPLQLAYGVTVHRVQGCTVQKAIVVLSDQFFESGQAYAALSRVRKMEDLVLWDFDPAAIQLAILV
jgi:ATP-dependent DNA helicase PIF1